MSHTLLSPESRLKLAADPALGCGNFFRYAVEANPKRDEQFIWLDRECRTFFGETYSGFSLSGLLRAADRYAAWYYGMGVREKDPVCVYREDGIEFLIHYVALTGLGAIPILLNGNMPAPIAAIFLQRAGAVGLFCDESHLAAITPHLEAPLRFRVTDEIALNWGTGELPDYYPFQHVDSDPVLIGHSSGTTGIPKAVVFHHTQFFYGIRYRLGMPQAPGTERLLSALPHSHSAGIAYLMLAILAGNSIKVLSKPFGRHVLESIEAFRPSMVAAFPETWVSLTEENMGDFDLSSVRLWVNGGDAAHEAHIRKLLSFGTRTKEGQPVAGSIFVDGMGSSEMGFSLFRHVHTPDTDDYNRCVGTPLEWVDAQVLGEGGQRLPAHQVGRLGVKGPSITPGYWNDSLMSARAQVRGYWLTGDLVFKDEKGRFYHVDRIPDAIQTAAGMVYSLQSEERLMKTHPEIIDCSIVGSPIESNGSKLSAAVALVRFRPDVLLGDEKDWLARFNRTLRDQGLNPLSALVFEDRDGIPLGATGKVLKRELRDHFRGFFTRSRAEAGPAEAALA